MPPRSRLLAALAPVLVAVACSSDGGSGASGCAEPVQEPPDPGLLLHVLPDAEVQYSTNPPTSGPHLSGPLPTGVLYEEQPGPVQVAMLEQGWVLVQYDPSIDGAQKEFLEGLAGDQVVVAPNSTMDDPVVATAWRWKLSCESVDADALDRFIADRAGAVGPDH